MKLDDDPTGPSSSDAFELYKPKNLVPLKQFFEAGGLDGIPFVSLNPEFIYTKSQEVAVRQLEDLSDAYFSNSWRELAIEPRFNALLIAATGCGKSKIVRELARRTGSELLVVSAGEWICRGAHEQPSTMASLLRVLERTPKTILLLDELDKFVSTTDSAWIRACAAEIWDSWKRPSRGPASFF